MTVNLFSYIVLTGAEAGQANYVGRLFEVAA